MIPEFEELFREASVPAKGAHYFIRCYQLTLSSLIGRSCRFMPSCSEYTDEAILRHGFIRGGALGVKRFCKCNPFFEGGIDNVPHK
jgi:uncharacterized protein